MFTLPTFLIFCAKRLLILLCRNLSECIAKYLLNCFSFSKISLCWYMRHLGVVCMKQQWRLTWGISYVYQERSHWEGQGAILPSPHFNFPTKQGPKVSVSNIRDAAFYGCSEIIRSKIFSFKHQGYCFLRMFRNYTDQNFTVFTIYATTFMRQFMAAFHFF